MFAKNSRYRNVADVVAIGPDGRALRSKDIRPLAPVSGTFQHVIEDVDRLDRLGNEYYQQPRKWWRICDANLDELSPQALLGKDPVVTYRLSLSPAGPEAPPWSQALNLIADLVGVEDVQFSGDELDQAAFVVRFNQMNLSVWDIRARIVEMGIHVEPPQEIGRIGKPITIPPDTVS